MGLRSPSWLPWLGPVFAAVAGGLAGVWLGGGFWVALGVALVFGFMPVVGYRLWQGYLRGRRR